MALKHINTMGLRWKQLMTVLIIATGMFFTPVAQAGVVDKLLKTICKASKETAELLIKEAAEKSSSIARLVKQYGDDAIVTLAKTPQRLKIVNQLGDDAAEAMLKHADIAEDALILCPDPQVAAAFKNFSRATGQNLSICASKNALTSEGYKTVVLIAREGGEETAERLAKMPPSKLQQVLHTAADIGLGAALAVVGTTALVSDNPIDFIQNLCQVGSWIWNHPILTILIFVLLVSLIIKFPDITLRIILWIPKACWKLLNFLWRQIRGKATA